MSDILKFSVFLILWILKRTEAQKKQRLILRFIRNKVPIPPLKTQKAHGETWGNTKNTQRNQIYETILKIHFRDFLHIHGFSV